MVTRYHSVMPLRRTVTTCDIFTVQWPANRPALPRTRRAVSCLVLVTFMSDTSFWNRQLQVFCRLILMRYRLGKGTFAEVRKAVNIDTGALRAIKVSSTCLFELAADHFQQIVKHRFAGNDKTLLMFQREIEICARLEHVRRDCDFCVR